MRPREALLVVVVVFSGCGGDGNTHADAGAGADAARDASADSAVDAVLDAQVDMAIDAPPIVLTFAQEAYLKATHPDANDEYGQAIALSSDGSTLVVARGRKTAMASGSRAIRPPTLARTAARRTCIEGPGRAGARRHT